jgi:hypothetical protein|tara:strand:+ start:119 stop:856 length:738 start_codon:yes stop_codon:yes gene_type:complete
MTTTTPDPVSNNVERVLVRNTATGMEQGVAAAAGLFTAGPLGALASWGAIRGLQGKWTPWFVIGIPATIGINIVNLVVTMGILGAIPDETWEGIETEIDRYEQSYDSTPSTDMVPPTREPDGYVGNEPYYLPEGGVIKASSEKCTTIGLNRVYGGFPCKVNLRTNYNGDSVYDVKFQDGKNYRVVLWEGGKAEIFVDTEGSKAEGIRSTGTFAKLGDDYFVYANDLWLANDPSIKYSFSFPAAGT